MRRSPTLVFLLASAIAHAQLPDAPKPTATTTDVTVTTLRPEPKHILGFIPNYRAVSAGTTPPFPTVPIKFRIATDQSFDPIGLVGFSVAVVINEGRATHPSLGKGVPGYGRYLWRGFLDRTDRSYQSAFLFPTLYREDPRYYAMERGNPFKRAAYAASRVVVTRTDHGHETFNFAGISGKFGAEAISRTFYPGASFTSGAIAHRFGIACARDAGFSILREFYPDLSAHFHHRPRPEAVN